MAVAVKSEVVCRLMVAASAFQPAAKSAIVVIVVELTSKYFQGA
jgi:hypothetical protein